MTARQLIKQIKAYSLLEGIISIITLHLLIASLIEFEVDLSYEPVKINYRRKVF